MICPCLTRLETAYLYKYYPQQYEDWINKIRLYEQRFDTKWQGNQSIDDIDKLIRTKWINTLNDKEKYQQLEFKF